MARSKRRMAFAVGFALVAMLGVLWGIGPQDAVRTGLWVGSAAGLVNLLMLWLRQRAVSQMSLARAGSWMRINLASRMAVLVLVLLLVQRQLGTSGDIAFLGGFFMVEAAILILLAKEQG